MKGLLARMETLGVIEKIEQPTDWCAGLVVKQTLAQLAGVTVFSTLDANSGFWSHMSPLY